MPNKKQQILDWLDITRIRILNFIKEHKYVSSAIALFIVFSATAIIAALADDDLKSADFQLVESTSNKYLEVATESEDNTKAPNYSHVTYSLKYHIGPTDSCDSEKVLDKVTIVATLKDSKNLSWIGATENELVEIDDKKITITSENIPMCTTPTQVFSLMVLNSATTETSQNIELSGLTLQAGSNGTVYDLLTTTESTKKIEDIPVVTTEAYSSIDSLVAKVDNGVSIKNSDFTRNAIFGLTLGFMESQENFDLKGKYIKDDAKIYLKASNQQGQTSSYLDLSLKDGDFGVYDDDIKNKRYFTNFPVLTSSGKVNKLIKSSVVSSTSSQDKTTTPQVTLIPKELTYESYPGIVSDIQRDIEGTSLSFTAKSVGDLNSEAAPAKGKYNVTYAATSGENKIEIKQKINIIEKEGTVTVKGPKIQFISSATFTDYGLYNYDGEFTTKYFNEDNEEVTTLESGNLYTEKYYDSSSTEIASRKLNYNYESAKNTLTVPSIAIRANGVAVKGAESSYNSSNELIYIDGDTEGKKCSELSSCSASTPDLTQNSTAVTYKIDQDNYSISLKQNITVEDGYYELNIKDLELVSEIESEKIGNKFFYKLGTYYVTTASVSVPSNVTLKTWVNEITNEENSNTVALIENSKGTNTYSNKLYVNESGGMVEVDQDEKSGSLSGNYYSASIGEKVEDVVSFNYGIDADNDIDKLTLLLTVDSHLSPVSYDENATTPYYYLKYSTLDNDTPEELPNVKMNYCKSSTSCDIEPEAYDPTKDTITHIKVEITPTEEAKLSRGTAIYFKTAYIVNLMLESDNWANEHFNITSQVSWTANSLSESSNLTTKSAYLTPYKVRSDILVGKNANEVNKSNITLDASKNDIYTVASNPSITSPIMAKYSNIFGYNSIGQLYSIFTLPAGLNYVANDNYQLQPHSVKKESNGTTTVTYRYNGCDPNSWLENIYFDFNVDITTPHETILDIINKIGDFNTVNITNDLSSSDKFKTNTATVRIVNTENIAYGQYAYSTSTGNFITSIDKNQSFIFKTKLYNNNTPANDISVYTVLPYNSDSNASNYDGDYWIKQMPNLPSDATLSCTTDSAASIISDGENANWQDCSSFLSNGVYTGFSAYKVTYSSLEPGNALETAITIQTSGNLPDNKYVFKSFLSYTSNSNDSGYLSFSDLSIDVISKKITGNVWEDFNDNGVMEDDETRLESVSLSLYTESGELVETTSPNENGFYSFSGLAPAKYYIVADFNNDKYSVTTALTNYADATKVNVFKLDSETIINASDNSTSPMKFFTNKSKIKMLAEEDDYNGEDYSEDEFSDEDYSEDEFSDEDYEEEPEEGEDSQTEEEEEPISIVKTDIIEVTENTKTIGNINLGLSLRKKFEVKINKYISRTEVTNALGVVTKTEYGNVKLAKVNVKSMTNVKIKVVYNLELENVKYYPGYITLVTEQIPDGMKFNPSYSENKGWKQEGEDILINQTLENDLIGEGEKRYLTIAFDITSKQAGSFVNIASVDGLSILGGAKDEE